MVMMMMMMSVAAPLAGQGARTTVCGDGGLGTCSGGGSSGGNRIEQETVCMHRRHEGRDRLRLGCRLLCNGLHHDRGLRLRLRRRR
jgi:hypothetical protein